MIVRKLSKPGLNTCPILGLERKTRYITTAKFLPFLKNYSGDVESKKLIKANEIKTKWVSGKGEGETSQNYGFFLHAVKEAKLLFFGKRGLYFKNLFFFILGSPCSINAASNKYYNFDYISQQIIYLTPQG